jgi:hypothetical protein
MKKIIELCGQYHYEGCCYGQPDGPDDFLNECDCDIPVEISYMEKIRASLFHTKQMQQEIEAHLKLASETQQRVNNTHKETERLKQELFQALGQ